MADFKNHFSKQANLYAQYRPVYPDELFDFLNKQSSNYERVWDCGTGNGQCAIQLVKHFAHVYASDPSQNQIDNAFSHERITYAVEKAEKTQLASNSVDLIVVAQALHWFNQKAFFEEANRVMKEDAVMAVISYVNPEVSKEIDALTDDLHDEILGDYWQPENKLIFNQYRDVEFPFQTIPSPEFSIEKKWSLMDFKGHLRTWSAVQRFIDKNGINPISKIENDLIKYWQEEEIKVVSWKMHLMVGRKIN